MDTHIDTLSSRLIRSFAVALSLVGMVLATSVILNGRWIMGLAMLVLTVLGYALAEGAFRKPVFWLVPGFWVVFTLIAGGTGAKGEVLLIGALPLLLVMSFVRRRAAKQPDPA